MLDSDLIAYSFTNRRFYCRALEQVDYGHYLWQQNISVMSIHWDTLFSNLRKRIPDNIYKNNAKVASVELNDHAPNKITLECGTTYNADLVVFADGTHSLGRRLISNNEPLIYCDYVAWRGVISFDLIPMPAQVSHSLSYYCFDKGHLLTYPVHHAGVKKLNWVLYEKISLDHLESLGTANPLNCSATSHLHQLAEAKLPKEIAQIITKTANPFMQKIFDVCTKKLTHKNSLLLGDAGIVLRPHVGSGASLALQDALDLSTRLTNCSVPQALSQWEESRFAERTAAYQLSQRMAHALVFNPTVWQEMTELTMAQWWEQIILTNSWYTTNLENSSFTPQEQM